jgi:hypothetical protein
VRRFSARVEPLLSEAGNDDSAAGLRRATSWLSAYFEPIRLGARDCDPVHDLRPDGAAHSEEVADHLSRRQLDP